MAIELKTPSVDELDDVVRALRNWQRDDTPIQLHPGDLGWHWRFGAEVLAAAVRTWSRGGKILAVRFLDSPDVLRMTVVPEVWRENELARAVASDLSEPERGYFLRERCRRSRFRPDRTRRTPSEPRCGGPAMGSRRQRAS